MTRFFLLPCALGLLGLSLGGCTAAGVATAAGGAAGLSAAQEGGISRAVDDAVIQTQINDLWLREDVKIFQKLDLTINNGRVLITGVVQDPQHRVDAVRLAWQPKGVKQVINEIQVAEGDGIPGFFRDNWITTRLRSAITVDRDVQSLNYNIDTVKGVVYLMGFAQNQVELNRVVETARTIPNVKQVVSYVKTVDGSVVPEAGQSFATQPPVQNVPENFNAQAPEQIAPAAGSPLYDRALPPVTAEPLDNSAYDQYQRETGESGF